MRTELKTDIKGWLGALEQRITDSALRGQAVYPTLFGFKTSTGEAVELPSYSFGLPQPLALRAALDLMTELGMDLLAEISSSRVCRGSHCWTYNSLLAFTEGVIYRQCVRPLYGAGGIADVIKQDPDHDVVAGFVNRVSLAETVSSEMAKPCRVALAAKAIHHKPGGGADDHAL